MYSASTEIEKKQRDKEKTRVKDETDFKSFSMQIKSRDKQSP